MKRALQALELETVLARVAGRASTEPGRDAVLALRPSTDPDRVRAELDRVVETRGFLEDRPTWSSPSFPAVAPELERLGVDGSVLEAGQLHRLGLFLASARSLAEAVEERGEPYPSLVALASRLFVDRSLEDTLAKSVDAEGTVRDEASSDLRALRRRLRKAHGKIVQRLEAFVKTLPERVRVADASVTVRDGRYVIAIRREGKGEVGGVVRDESASGATLFVEPPQAVELMNELGELEREEAREVQRILRELTARLTPRAAALEDAYAALVDFDTLQARAKIAEDWAADAPEISGDRTLSVHRGRHPLLLDEEDDPVPFDLTLEDDEVALVVSGPNTGGKTVFLKAVGLIAALTQSGVVPPVASGTRLPVFDAIFADIGDRQSIEASLSTFSARLENLKHVLREAGPRSLVLIDEMGSGTDPAEGAALARAIIEELVDRGTRTIVTSHLGALKHLDRAGSGIVNASLQFDPDRVEPTYGLVKGVPGRSYGLVMARRLGLPRSVLERAEAHRSAGEASIDDLLEKLARKEKEADELVRRLESEQATVSRLRGELEARAEALEDRERTAERRAKQRAREVLLEAREEVEQAIREVKTASSDELGERSRKARRRVESAVREHEVRPEPRRGPAVDLAEGQRVRVGESGATGELVEVRDDKGVVETGSLRMEVPLGELVPVDDEPSREPVRDVVEIAEDPAWEVDLRGFRVIDVDLELARALDAAVLGDLDELRIIHGKGTGAVRSRVQELLKLDKRVRSYRFGTPAEGGTGVTIAEVTA